MCIYTNHREPCPTVQSMYGSGNVAKEEMTLELQDLVARAERGDCDIIPAPGKLGQGGRKFEILS